MLAHNPSSNEPSHPLSHERPELLLGDRYHLIEALGNKAGRQTWLADNVTTQMRVVLKLLVFGSAMAWEDLKLFEREAQTLQAIDHPAIPEYLDYLELEGPQGRGFALVQRYIEARSLDQLLAEGQRFSEAEVQQLGQALLEILVYLHDRNPPVIHRDIKPSNILVDMAAFRQRQEDRSGNVPMGVYLVDFGSVQSLAATEGGTITVVGTYGYMPPEQFGGRAVPASDLYSVGATLIYVATGQHPADLPQVDLKLEFADAANLGPRLTRWLQGLVEPSLNRRFASATEALQALERPLTTQDYLPQTVLKPRQTPIRLSCDRRSLSIQVPSRRIGGLVGLLPVTNSLGLFILVGIPLLVPFAVMALMGSGLVVMGLFAGYLLMLVLVLLVAGASSLMMRIGGRMQIQVDRDRIEVTQNLFGWSATEQTVVDAPRRHLWKLAYSPWTRRLGLWIGTQKLEISGSTRELEWLAFELSEWLEIPVTEEHL